MAIDNNYGFQLVCTSRRLSTLSVSKQSFDLSVLEDAHRLFQDFGPAGNNAIAKMKKTIEETLRCDGVTSDTIRLHCISDGLEFILEDTRVIYLLPLQNDKTDFPGGRIYRLAIDGPSEMRVRVDRCSTLIAMFSMIF